MSNANVNEQERSKELLLDRAEVVATNLSDSIEAMELTLGSMSSEGCQHQDNFEEFRAIVFAQRLPTYLSTLRTIVRDIETQAKEIQSAVDDEYQRGIAKQ